MKLTCFDPALTYYIWTPSALLGCDLLLTKNVLVQINNNLIADLLVVTREDLPSAVIKSANFSALNQGCILLPSLIDAHLHLALNGVDYNRARAAWSNRGERRKVIKEVFAKLLQAGVGAVRDGGDSAGLNLEAKRLAEDQVIKGPLVVATGKALREKGGYGSFLGAAFNGTASIPAAVRETHASGSDQLKVIVSGIVSFCSYGNVKGPVLSPLLLGSIVERAHLLGLKVMAHASSDEAVRHAVVAGVDSIEHGYFVRKDTLKMMAEKQIAWIPTIIPVAAQVGSAFTSLRTEMELDIIRRTYAEQQEKLNTAISAGVPLGIGTDAGATGVMHGQSLVEEMMLYSEALFGNSREGLKAATSTNARILGLDKELGSITLGKKAMFIAVRGNPLENPAALRNIERHYLA